MSAGENSWFEKNPKKTMIVLIVFFSVNSFLF